MAGKPSDTSNRAIAARLSVELGRIVTEKCVKVWRVKGYDLADIPALRKAIADQVRGPKRIQSASDPNKPESPPDEPSTGCLDVEGELRKLQRRLIEATTYEDARTLKMQIAGVSQVLKELRAQGHYVTKESQIREGMATGQTIKSLVLKIPAELPQQLVGLDYPDAVLKCEDYAYSILTALSEAEEGNAP